MGRLGTVIRVVHAAALATATSAGAAAAMPATQAAQAAAFASCVGTYAAETEHMRLFDGSRSEALDSRRAHFAALLEAVAPRENGSVAHGAPMKGGLSADTPSDAEAPAHAAPATPRSDAAGLTSPPGIEQSAHAPRSPGAELRALLVQSRMAHRALLGDAAFHPDARRRVHAAQAAERRRGTCDRLLLGG